MAPDDHEFLREHEKRMERVDEALEQVRRKGRGVRGVRDHLVMNTEPLRLLLLPVAALALAAAAQAFIDGADVRGIITAVLGVLIAAATELARSRVTPVP
jgi:hypothetical protein